MPTGPRPPWPEGVAKMIVAGSFGDTRWENIFYVQVQTYAAATFGDWDLFVDAFISALDTSGLYQELGTSLRVTAVRGVLHQAPDLFLDRTRGASFGGARTGAEVPGDTAVVVSWYTGVSQRGGKPRTYLSGVVTPMMGTEKFIDDTVRNSIAEDANTLLTSVAAIAVSPFTDPDLGMVSFQAGHAWRTPPIFREYFTSAVHERFGSQRRRLGKWEP